MFFVVAEVKNNSFRTSFNPEDCHMDKLAKEQLKDCYFSSHVVVPANRRQISISNKLK